MHTMRQARKKRESIPLFDLHVTKIKRSAGQSAVTSAAYRSGERLHSEYYGEDSDYTRKGGVLCSEILLPPHDPPSFADRQTLWNEVEKAERGKKVQLTYSFDIALQKEFSMEENIDLARQFLLEQFVRRGMVALPTRIFMSCVQFVPCCQMGHGAISSGGNIFWIKTGSAYGMKQKTMCSTLSPPRIEANRKCWNIGGNSGRQCAMLDLPRKGWIAASTTADRSVRAWSSFLLSMRAQRSARWRPEVSVPIKANSSYESRRPMP